MSKSRAETILRNFHENEDFFRTTAKSNIELYRKGRGEITVTDKDGKPLSGVKIKYRLKNHEFKFGANLFMLDELETEEKNKAYKTSFKKLFNLATLPFYWDAIEPERGKTRYEIGSEKIYRRPAPDLCLKYCQKNGIEPKLHCLNYDNFIPEWLKDKPIAEIKKEYVRRFREISARYGDIIPTMEVTNELLCPSDATRSDFFFADDNAEWSYRTADSIFPNTKLIINEAPVWDYLYADTNRNPYYMQIENLLQKNLRIDSIGMQYHSFWKREDEEKIANTRYNPEFVYRLLDKFSQLDRPLQITEMTIPAYSDSEEDENVQAEILKYVYIMFFAHPAMEAVIYWNLPDGYAAFAPQGDMEAGENYFRAGLLRFDLSEKPAYKMLDKLINHDWHTEDASETAADGTAKIRGFYGDYELIIEKDGKEFKTEAAIRKNGVNRYTFKFTE